MQASSQTFLESVPPILVLHLKLFDYDPTTNSSSKVLKRIQFEESFEIPKECLSRNYRGVRKYKLLAGKFLNYFLLELCFNIWNLHSRQSQRD